MKLKLKRKFKGSEYTIGDLFIDGVFYANVLEDAVRVLKDLNHDGDFNDANEGKIFGRTAIPSGIYKVIITYSNHFKRDLPLLVDVYGYEGIRIHPGNDDGDTEGCLLIGKNDVKGKVTNSKFWTEGLITKIKSALDNKEEVTIEIV